MARLGAEGHGLKFCCGLLGLAPSEFFRWRSQPTSARDIGSAWLGDLIVQVWKASRRTYRKRRIRAELRPGIVARRFDALECHARNKQLGSSGPALRVSIDTGWDGAAVSFGALGLELERCRSHRHPPRTGTRTAK